MWPQALVFKFKFGRLCSFVALFTVMYAMFFAMGSMRNLSTDGVPLFFCLMIAYIIPASDYISEQVVLAFDSLKPNLELSPHELEKTRERIIHKSLSTQLNSLGTGFLLGCAHVYLLILVSANDPTWIRTLLDQFQLIATVVIWCLITTVINQLISNARIFARLAREHTRIDLFDAESLGAFSRVAVYSTLVLVGAQASMPLLLLQSEANYLTMIPGFLLLSFAMLVIFLLPLLPISARIRNHKQRELALIQDRIGSLMASHSSPLEDDKVLVKLQPLLEYRREVKQVSAWPFESTIFFRLLIYLVIPPITWVGAALIERLMESVNI